MEGELKPCSNEVMLAGMLGVLRDSHWCAACAVVTAAVLQAVRPLQAAFLRCIPSMNCP